MKRATQAAETPQVGRAVPRLESWLKVTGRAEYVHNLRLPGMLYGKIFRSTVAHGRIKGIDTSAARALAGVHSVVTAKEILKILPGPLLRPPLPRPADPRGRQGALRRRAGGGGARFRPARRGGGGAPD